jgi:hypothetical protein
LKLVGAIALLAIGPACLGPAGGDGDPEGKARSDRPSPSVYEAVTEAPEGWFESGCSLPLEQLRRIRRGYNPRRSPDILFVPREPNQFFNNHSGPWDYIQRVPIALYGPGFIEPRGRVSPKVEPTVADLAPTFAELLGFDEFPQRAGRVLETALVPQQERPKPPKLILTVVWDGGGRFVLDAWPKAWPTLKRLGKEGTWFDNAIVGSSPSVTPPIHSNIGTGTFPKEHGIIDIPLRDGDQVVDSWPEQTPRFLDVPTLGDLYDQATDNRPKVGMFAYKNWHLGMIGHGAYLPGGDKDVAVLVDGSGGFVTNEEWYSVPSWLHDVTGLDEDTQTIDAEDGKLDGQWMGRDLLQDPKDLRNTPAWVLYQTRVLEELLKGEGFGADDVPDLFYTNYKQIDQVGHHMGMLKPEMENVLRHTDAQLEKLIEFLDRRVGKRAWVLAVTADHGPSPDFSDTRGWPIHMLVFRDALGKHLDIDPDELLIDERSSGFWPDQDVLAEQGITEGDIADFVINYRLEQDVPPGKEMGSMYEGRGKELLFSAAFPADRLGQIWQCALDRNK